MRSTRMRCGICHKDVGGGVEGRMIHNARHHPPTFNKPPTVTRTTEYHKQRCPICVGQGKVPFGFYKDDEWHTTCRACYGSGIV